MVEPAAIAGTFSDLKTVKTRSVVQMIIEVPIERGAEIIAAFGFPRPGDEVPVAVARLDPEKVKHAPEPPEKPRKPFEDYTLAQQAGMRCGDEKFWEFLLQRYNFAHMNKNAAANFVRDTCCNGQSRTFLSNVPEFAEKWRAINDEFMQWAGLAAVQHG